MTVSRGFVFLGGIIPCMRENEPAAALFFIGFVIVVVGLGIWASFAMPCGCYAGSRLKDVPARCIEGVIELKK